MDCNKPIYQGDDLILVQDFQRIENFGKGYRNNRMKKGH